MIDIESLIKRMPFSSSHENVGVNKAQPNKDDAGHEGPGRAGDTVEQETLRSPQNESKSFRNDNGTMGHPQGATVPSNARAVNYFVSQP